VGSLGTIAKTVNPVDFDKLSLRYNKQRQAGHWLPKERVNQCLVRHAPSASDVCVVRSENGNMSYRNLMLCGSVWHCPCCAAKISEVRRSDLVEAVAETKNIGGRVLMLTLTAPHGRDQSCAELVEKLQAARTKFTNRKIWKQFSHAVNLFGSVRALEVTYGQNGWHVHFHVLLFIQANDNGHVIKYWQGKLLDSWISSTAACGLVGTNEHGLDLQDDENFAAEYATKWGVENELTKGHIKKSKGGYSPFDLLDENVQVEDFPLDSSRRKAAFREYALAFKGKRQLVWSVGLRGLLLSNAEELSDIEIAEKEESGNIVARIQLVDWYKIISLNLRVDVLQAYYRGNPSEIDLLFHRLRSATG